MQQKNGRKCVRARKILQMLTKSVGINAIQTKDHAHGVAKKECAVKKDTMIKTKVVIEPLGVNKGTNVHCQVIIKVNSDLSCSF